MLIIRLIHVNTFLLENITYCIIYYVITAMAADRLVSQLAEVAAKFKFSTQAWVLFMNYSSHINMGC